MIPISSVPVDNSRKTVESTPKINPIKKTVPLKVETVNPEVSKESENKIDVLLSKMTDLIDKLQNLPISVPQTVNPVISNPYSVKSEEIYIPSRVVPDKADVKINLQEKSQENTGLEEASKALKKLRTKK
jgi:hypothetical protein